MCQKGPCLHEFCCFSELALYNPTQHVGLVQNRHHGKAKTLFISNLIQQSCEHSALMIQTFPNHTQHPQPYVLTKLYAVRIHKKTKALFLRKYV